MGRATCQLGEGAGVSHRLRKGGYVFCGRSRVLPDQPGIADDHLWKRSIAALVDEARRSEQLQLDALVLHPGAHRGMGEVAGIARIVAALAVVEQELGPARVAIALEGTAGQGTQLGYRFEHLRDILAGAGCQRVTVCLDTCHLLAAGYDLSADDACQDVFEEFDRVVGHDNLMLFHLNDSRRELGSRVDRHAHIGRGHIGQRAFEWILNWPSLAGIPKILETPKDDDGLGDRRNLELLRSLVRS